MAHKYHGTKVRIIVLSYNFIFYAGSYYSTPYFVLLKRINNKHCVNNNMLKIIVNE